LKWKEVSQMMAIIPAGSPGLSRATGSRASPGLALFAMPVGAPTAGIPTPSTSSSQVPHREHRGWIYAAIAMIAAVLVLGVMGAFQYAQTRDTATTTVVTSGVPAEFAGVSLPQAMRLADAAAVSSGVPAEFAGVSLPQAMRLADAAAVTSR
jgi:hypothetical protein